MEVSPAAVQDDVTASFLVESYTPDTASGVASARQGALARSRHRPHPAGRSATRGPSRSPATRSSSISSSRAMPPWCGSCVGAPGSAAIGSSRLSSPGRHLDLRPHDQEIAPQATHSVAGRATHSVAGRAHGEGMCALFRVGEGVRCTPMPAPIVGRDGEWRAIERLLEGAASAPASWSWTGRPGSARAASGGPRWPDRRSAGSGT